MITNLKKTLIYLFIFFICLSFFFFFYYRDLFLIDNFQNLLVYYEELKAKVEENKLFYIITYIIISILWICLLGIVTPMLVISTILFGYTGCILSIISFTIGSIISYEFAKNFRESIKIKSMNKYLSKLKIKKNAFFLFIIFRFIPGIPFMIKNFSGVLFNLNNKKFVVATLLADSPQIFFFGFILKKFIDSSEILLNNSGIPIYRELLIPSILVILFLILIFIIRVKFLKNFSKK